MASYGKRPIWQWVLIYVVIGGIIYAAIYFLFLKGDSGYNYQQSTPNSTAPESNSPQYQY